MMPDSISSNVTGLSIAQESAPKVLPAGAKFYEMEPNSFGDFGADYGRTARRPIRANRSRSKGSITSMDAGGDFNVDICANDLLKRHVQGFLFADAREKPQNRPMNGTEYAVTGIAAGTGVYTGAAGIGAASGIKAGHIVRINGASNVQNNGVFDVTAVASTTVTTSNAGSVAEPAPPANVNIEAVGFKFAAGDVVLSLPAGGGVLRAVATAGDFSTLGLTVGEWVFIGGDAAGLNLGANVGYARIAAIAAKTLDFDKTTFAAEASTGTGKQFTLYFGTTVRNETDVALIRQRSYTLQRALGHDGDGIQSELLQGSFASELALTSPLEDKLNADLTYVSMDHRTRTGAEGLISGVNGASILPVATGLAAYNTTTDVYRLRAAILDSTTLNPTALFGYVEEYDLTINNNVSIVKAQGTFGFAGNVGGFDVTGSLTAYFGSVQAIAAIRANADVTFDAIYAARNTAFIIDLPLISFGGGQLDVEADTPIKLPVDTEATEGPNGGHALLLTFLSYVPTAGMPA
jgi:hypothetical protein